MGLHLTVDQKNRGRTVGSTPSLQTRSAWRGTCVHDFETPRWVQKQRRIDPDEPLHERNRVYEEPRRAVAIAINGTFSLIAIGTYGCVRF
jgi:hypothetical protein